MRPDDITAAIARLASGYATALEPELRASARAQLLGLLEKLGLEKRPLTTEDIDAARFQTDAHLRGAVRAHLDLAFRSSMDPAELLAVCTRGIVRVAWHPDIADFPVGVALALPASVLPRARADLFADETRTVSGSPLLILSALATNPARLGAAAKLIEHLLADCARLTPRARLVAFSPLTGLRARVLKMVTSDEAWAGVGESNPDLDAAALRQQVEDVLALERAPATMPEPLASWLAQEASAFADDESYVVGRFHRAQGAVLVGVAHDADPNDSDALWARALFDYPVEPKRSRRADTVS